MKLRRSCLSVCHRAFQLSVAAGVVLGLEACSLRSTPHLSAFDNVKVGTPESTLASCFNIDRFPDDKRFPGETSYVTETRDPDGAVYVYRCREGVCSEIEVIYPDSGVQKKLAFDTMRRLFPAPLPAIVEHDESEIKQAAAISATEYFYFKKNYIAEINYRKGDPGTVLWINAWR